MAIPSDNNLVIIALASRSSEADVSPDCVSLMSRAEVGRERPIRYQAGNQG